jgi:hypothetical protein
MSKNALSGREVQAEFPAIQVETMGAVKLDFEYFPYIKLFLKAICDIFLNC